jgi:hypothetical protein
MRSDRDDVVEAVVTDIDGNPVSGVPIQIAIRGVLGSERYRDDAQIIDTQSCRIASARTAGPLPFKRRDRKPRTRRPLPWRTAAAVRTPRCSRFPGIPSQRAAEDLVVVPDKPVYRVGDVAKLEIVSKVSRRRRS